MGFYVNEFEIELKQHLNLSEQAWLVILEDIRNFYPDDEKQSFSGFLNRIFFNFYQESEATISQRFIYLSDKLKSLFSTKEFSADKDKVEAFISKILNTYEKYLIEKSCSYKKGYGKKFRINKANLEILRDSTDSIYYNDNIGLYLKAVLEEYTTLPTYRRELIFFKDIKDKIELAIATKRKLKAILIKKISGDGKECFQRKFYVSPYKILQDKTNSFNYLIGFTEEISPDKALDKKQIASLRLSRISRIDIMNSLSGFISKSDKELLEKEIIEKTPQYLAGDIIDIEVIFTKKGLENFNRQLYMRPLNYEKISSLSYVFHCTEIQALNYFFKFGKEIKVVSPTDLKEKFKLRYLEALNNYNE